MMKEQTKTKYFEAVGRRKTSTARVRLYPTSGTKNSFKINGKDLKDYFPTEEMRHVVNSPLGGEAVKTKFDITVVVNGGGIHSQSEALKHGIARALILSD